MKRIIIVLGIVAIVGIFLIGWYISGINYLVALHENVNSSWAQVENQLQRRADLIPNLVNTVKGYAKQESSVFENVTKARTMAMNATSMDDKLKS